MKPIKQVFEGEILINGYNWLPTEGKIERSKYTESDYATITAIKDYSTDDNIPNPQPGDKMTVRLGPRTSVTTDGGRDAVEDDLLVTVFTGNVSNVFDFGDRRWKINGFNVMDTLQSVTISTTDIQKTKLSKAVEIVLQKIQRETSSNVQYNIDLSESQELPYGYSRFITDGPQLQGEDYVLRKEFTNVNAADVLDSFSRSANAIWYVDRKNTIQFGQTDTAVHKLDWVTEADAGKKTPPYRSVKVIGDDVVSAEGWEGSKLITKRGQVAQKTNSYMSSFYPDGPNNPGSQTTVPEGDLVEPVFTFRDESIQTKEEARRAAERILDQLQEQTAGGNVTVVGRPMIDILDVIEMPDRFAIDNRSPITSAEEIEPAQYFVQSVVHQFDGSNGYTTKIQCGGLAGRYSGPVFEYKGINEDGIPGRVVLSSKESNQDVSPSFKEELTEDN